jgi:hypothetical protein
MFFSEQRSEALIGLGFIGVGAFVYLLLFRGRFDVGGEPRLVKN